MGFIKLLVFTMAILMVNGIQANQQVPEKSEKPINPKLLNPCSLYDLFQHIQMMFPPYIGSEFITGKICSTNNSFQFNGNKCHEIFDEKFKPEGQWKTLGIETHYRCKVLMYIGCMKCAS